MCVDVTKSADVRQMVERAVDQYGGLDYAFNNAGFVGSTAGVVETERGRLATRSGDEPDERCGMCMKYEIPEMLKRQGGVIVNNGSVVGLVGSSVAVGSVASKHGVSGLTKGSSTRVRAARGIRVNAVAPGMVRTPLC